MEKKEFLALDSKKKQEYCQKEFDSGKSYEQILEELGMTKKEMEAEGIYFVRGKFMVKPVKGYRTAGTGKDF